MLKEEVVAALAAKGIGVEPINRDKFAIKDEPKYRLVKLEK